MTRRVWTWVCTTCGAVGALPLDASPLEAEEAVSASHRKFCPRCPDKPRVVVPEAVDSERVLCQLKGKLPRGKRWLPVTTHEPPRPNIEWRDLTPDVLRRVLALCTGHNLIGSEALIEAGVPAELAAYYSRIVRSGVYPKDWIFDASGYRIEAIEAVVGLDVIDDIATSFGVEDTAAHLVGRGFRASALKEAIYAKLPPAQEAAP